MFETTRTRHPSPLVSRGRGSGAAAVDDSGSVVVSISPHPPVEDIAQQAVVIVGP